jgi:hypothetical protein
MKVILNPNIFSNSFLNNRPETISDIKRKQKKKRKRITTWIKEAVTPKNFSLLNRST